MAEMSYQKAERKACEKVTAALTLPLPESEEQLGIVGEFDPWDLFPSLYGSYDGDFDKLAIEVLEDIQNGTHKRRDLAARMFREMLCTADLCDYGTSPRGCFPNPGFKSLLPELLEKWRAYSLIAWGEDVTEKPKEGE
jgi:hypothetical protein